MKYYIGEAAQGTFHNNYQKEGLYGDFILRFDVAPSTNEVGDVRVSVAEYYG